MANTTSWSFPNIFNVSQNTVSIVSDEESISNRSKLLILTEPTEIYNDTQQGVGLKRYIGRYNNLDTRAEIKSRIIEKLRIYEPCVVSEKTTWYDELLYSGNGDPNPEGSHLDMTIALQTIYGTTVTVDLNEYLK